MVITYKYKYNGKELQDELGLNVIAMDWRQYDPAIGRFATLDPETDELEQLDKSPYAFAWNNPILYNDPDGRNPIKNLFKRLLKVVSKPAVKKIVKTETKELLKSQKSLTKLIAEHKQRLNDFNKDPIGNSSKEALEKMMQDNPSKEVLLKRAKGRATALEKQIVKQEGELAKVNKSLSGSGNSANMAVPLLAIKPKSLTGNANIDALGRNAANVSNFVENVGVKVFGDNDFGKMIDELNPLNIGIAPVLDNLYNK